MKEKFEIGQEVLITMCQPKEGKFPIGKTESGIICFLQKGSKGFFEYDSIWNCEVSEVKERFLIVKPLEQVVSAAANRAGIANKLSQLEKEKGAAKQERKPKVQKSFPYKSFQEARKETSKNK